MSKKFFITTPIYYVNAKPHIGHALTTIAGDVLARQHKLLGDDVYFLTGTDEHGAKIAKASEDAKLEPQKFVDQISVEFKNSWDKLDILYNDFIRTTEGRHKKAVEKFLIKLNESGKIYKGEYKGLYCVGCEAFKKESDLIEGLCSDHKIKAEELVEENWFFKLSEYSSILKEKIENNEIILEPESRKNEVLSLLNLGLEDIAISRPSVSWGIPLPFEKEHTIYVWVDALINYITSVGYESDEEKFNKYWPADLHLIGKEILRFHAVIWPAMLLAVDLPLPKKIFAHGFFTIGGEKMSKTVGNIIDPSDWVKKYGSDTIRYFLLREVPFGIDGDVSEEKLRIRYKTDLANSLGNLVSRFTNMVEQFSDGALPDIVESSQASKLQEAIILTTELKFSLSLEKIWEVISWANQTIDKEKPWELAKTDSEKLNILLSDIGATLHLLAKALAAYMPDTSEKIRLALETEKIVKVNSLFPIIE